MTYPDSRDCRHGSKRGSCISCDYEEEIEELEERIKELEAQLEDKKHNTYIDDVLDNL